jgi:hypothetical protein
MAVFFTVALAALAVAALVNAIKRRPALNGGRIGAVAILLLLLVRIGLVLSSPGPDLGRRVGSVVGQAFWPLVLSVVMDRRHAARVRQRPGGGTGAGS